MKYAFTARGETWESEMDPRLGRTEFILIYDESTNQLEAHSNADVTEHAHGAGPLTVQKIIELAPGVLITGNGPGKNAAEVLKSSKIQICIGAGDFTVREAFDAYKLGQLN